MDRDHSYDGWSKAFAIFAKYHDGKHGHVSAEHDEVFAGPNPDVVSDADKAELERYGWSVDEDVECFRHLT